MSYIQNLFTSRDNQTAAVDQANGNIGTTYVGQQGRLWYNPDDNVIYVSDGTTPGGIPVTVGSGNSNVTFNVVTANVINAGAEIVNGNIVVAVSAELGNLVIADQTISGNVNNRDVTIATVGANAAFNVLGPFHAHSTGNLEADPNFQVNSDGQVVALIPILDSNSGAVEIVGSTSGLSVPMSNPGGMIHITGQNNQVARIYNDAIANYSLYVGRRYNGTAAAPTGVLAGQVVSRLGANPYLGDADEFTSLGFAKIDFVATQDQTTTTQGSKVQIYTTPDGSNSQVLTATLQPEGIDLGGNLIPTVNNTYQLGNTTNKWNAVYIGPASLYIEDSVLHTNAELTVADGVLHINGTQKIEIGNMQMTTTGISLVTANTGSNIQVGSSGDTGYMQINMPGIKFSDASIQTTAAIPLSQRGAANGVASLDGSGKVPTSQLPAGATVYKGAWDASTNTPTLTNGVGTAGDEYSVSVGGTVNFGAGPITFAAGDFVIYSGTVWQKIPTSFGVTSFNTRTGAVTLTSGDVTNALSNSSITNSKLVNPAWTLTTGQGIGLTGSGTVALGNSITLTNTGVTAAIAGTGVAVSAATGNVTFSIGQAVGTANSVTFQAVTSNTTVAATGNVTGGNLATGGRVVATGNIVTSANIVTPGSIINSSMSTSGNVIGANILTGGLISATGNITGGNVSATAHTGTIVSATGNITGGNILTGGLISSTGNITGGNLNISTGGTIHTPKVIINDGGIRTVAGGTALALDFSTDSIVLWTSPSGTATITLSNYTPGATAKVIIRVGTTSRDINFGVVDGNNSTTGSNNFNGSGAGSTSIANQAFILDYTCYDTTAANCYVQVNWQ
jgi:hypothetical protein